MAHLNFRKDLENAKVTELVAAQLLRIFTEDNFDVTWNDDNRYDFAVETSVDDVSSYTYEVKDDIGSMNTPNTFVEFECRGKPSGIATTESDLHIYKIYNSPIEAKFYCIATQMIKYLIIQKKYKRIVSDAGDVGSNTKGYLFAKETIIDKADLLATEKTQIKFIDGNLTESTTYIVNGNKYKDIFNYFHKNA